MGLQEQSFQEWDQRVGITDKMYIMKKFPLGFFPTPLHLLKNLSRFYPGYKVYIKRDDQTGLATGGNKTRKLEYLLQEAMDQGCDTFVTAGAQQSNHCRQAAAACAVAGLKCHLLVRGTEPVHFNGNLLLSKLLGASIYYCGDNIREADVQHLLVKLSSAGHKPYYTPIGGSTLVGAMGYADAMLELKQQMDENALTFDYIFFASSSGGTQAGMVLGKALCGITARIMAISIDKDEVSSPGGLESTVRDMVHEGKSWLDIRTEIPLHDTGLVMGYGDAGYGVITDNERQAIRELAQAEGIFLDPVYTARSFYAMTDMLKKGLIESGSNVLFWHTGGVAANFYYAEELQPK